MGFLSERCSGKGPELALRGESPGFSLVVVGFLSCYDGDLRDQLVEPQGGPISTRVARGPSGYLCSQCWVRGPHLEFRPVTQVSSLGLTWISGFIWGIHRGVRPRLVWSHASLLSSRARKTVSGFLLG